MLFTDKILGCGFGGGRVSVLEKHLLMDSALSCHFSVNPGFVSRLQALKEKSLWEQVCGAPGALTQPSVIESEVPSLESSQVSYIYTLS